MKRKRNKKSGKTSVTNTVINYDITKNHNFMMQFFARKNGFDLDDKFFIFNSRDYHIKRALIKGGWAENKDIHS